MSEETIAVEAVNKNMELAEDNFKKFKENIKKCDIVETVKSYRNIFIHLETVSDYIFKVPDEKITKMANKVIDFKKEVETELTTFPVKCKCEASEPFRYIE